MLRNLLNRQATSSHAEHEGDDAPCGSPGGKVEMRFQQPCPACGRRMLILVEHLGRRVYCSHCGSPFTARDPAQPAGAWSNADSPMLARAELLLSLVESPRGAATSLR